MGSVQVYDFEVGNAILREEFSHSLGGNIAIDTHNSERICANGRAAERDTGNVDFIPGKDGADPGQRSVSKSKLLQTTDKRKDQSHAGTIRTAFDTRDQRVPTSS
jgi:hypothetical protein